MKAVVTLLALGTVAASLAAQESYSDPMRVPGESEEYQECRVVPWYQLTDSPPVSSKFLDSLAAGSLVPSPGWKVIDIGILSTPRLVLRAGGTANLERLNRETVNALNRAFAAGRMKVFARLVGQAQVDYTETGDRDIELENLTNGDLSGTGVFAGWRDLWGADLLTLAVSYGTGVAVLGDAWSVFGANDLGSTSCPSCAHVAIHEWGHNLFLQHDPGEPHNIDCSSMGTLAELCLRSHGFSRFTPEGDCLADTMAYGCPLPGNPSIRKVPDVRIEQYSNPETFYRGIPLGEPGVSEGTFVAEVYAQEVQNWKPTKASSTCTPDENRVCLNDSRFLVQAFWRTPDGQSGYAQAVPFGNESGLFTFFNSGNVELIVKVLNACVPSLGNKYWVFVGAMTNVEVNLIVIDTKTGARREYLNPLGRTFQAIQDVGAFPCN